MFDLRGALWRRTVTVKVLLAAGGVVTALFAAVPAWASESRGVVVTGPADSSLMTKIRAELVARGVEIVSNDATPDVALRVRVDDSGVTLETTDAPPETLAAETDEDVFARHVAENVRARILVPQAPEEERAQSEASPAAKDERPLSPAGSGPVSVWPVPAPAVPAPVRRFFHSGAWLLSADDALPLVSMGSAAPLSEVNAFHLGDSGGAIFGSPPRPLAVDLAIGEKLTLGISIIGEKTLTAGDAGDLSAGGGALRFGYAIPLGDHVALWPRLGVARFGGVRPAGDDAHRTDVVADVRVVWTAEGAWALTLGPGLAVPVEDGDTLHRDPDLFAVDRSPLGRQPRITLSAGLTIRLDEDSGATPKRSELPPPRFLLGVERIVPIVRYRIEETSEGSNRSTTEDVDIGTADTTNRFPTAQRVAFDVIWRSLTFGAAASMGWVRFSLSDGLVPSSRRVPEAFAVGLAPRVGGLIPLSKRVSFWPRAGATWVHAAASRPDAGDISEYHVGFDVDAFAILSPVEGVGIVLGPTMAIPIAGMRHQLVAGGTPYWTRDAKPIAVRQEYSFFSVSLSAGLVVFL